MRLYDTGLSRGKRIQDFGSTGAIISTLVSEKHWHIATLHLEPNGVLGSHRTQTDQLVIICEGAVKVIAEGQKAIDIGPGTAAFWSKGETHEMRAGERGCSAIIIEGDRLERNLVLPRKRVAS